mmetsp:Transcript_54601/g.156980  ORF Transcript_54601/g.156980 Transcript_54601/m.156980 type:complete len:220 (-) Transcript_54601:711-1370(-)
MECGFSPHPASPSSPASSSGSRAWSSNVHRRGNTGTSPRCSCRCHAARRRRAGRRRPRAPACPSWRSSASAAASRTCPSWTLSQAAPTASLMMSPTPSALYARVRALRPQHCSASSRSNSNSVQSAPTSDRLPRRTASCTCPSPAPPLRPWAAGRWPPRAPPRAPSGYRGSLQCFPALLSLPWGPTSLVDPHRRAECTPDAPQPLSPKRRRAERIRRRS